MTNYTTNIGVLKRAIVNFTEKLSDGTARPFHKFFADICFGAMSSKSCVITDVARALQEKAQIINTVERLTRHLSEPIPDRVQDNYVDTVCKYLPENIVVHIDDSDVTKPSGRAFEGISRVRDGSRSTESKSIMGNGYYVTEATVLTKSSHPVSIFSEIWSVESGAFTSGGEFEYTKKAVSNHHFKWWFANSPIRADYLSA